MELSLDPADMLPRSVSLIVLTVLIGCLGLAFLKVMAPFLLTMLLASVLAMLLQPVFRYFMVKTRGQRQAAAGLTTLAALASVMLPVLIGVFLGAVQLATWFDDFYSSDTNRKIVQRIYSETWLQDVVHRAQPYFDRGSNPEQWEQKVADKVQENLPKLLQEISSRTVGLAASTFGLLGVMAEFGMTIAVFVISLYFFLADGPQLLAVTRELLPLEQQHQERLLNQFTMVTRAVVMGTFLAAVAQGLAVGVGLYFAGIDRVILLTVVATIVAIVPIAGTSLVWVPCAVWVAYTHDTVFPVVLFVLYNMIVVSSVDNLVRAYVLNSDVKLHPLMAFVSVIGGIQWIGIWGVFAGPVIASCLYALMRIFKEELVIYGQQPTTQEAVAAAIAEQTKPVVVVAPVTAVMPPPATVAPPAAAEPKTAK